MTVACLTVLVALFRHPHKCMSIVGDAFSALLGAQINQPRFNSSGEYSAFGPWEQSIGAAFYPGVFSLQSAPSPINPGDPSCPFLVHTS